MAFLPDPLERSSDGTTKGYPCCHRRFPRPDPMFRHVDDDEGPLSFWRLPYDERSRRLRSYLLAVAAGVPPSWGGSRRWTGTPRPSR